MVILAAGPGEQKGSSFANGVNLVTYSSLPFLAGQTILRLINRPCRFSPARRSFRLDQLRFAPFLPGQLFPFGLAPAALSAESDITRDTLNKSLNANAFIPSFLRKQEPKTVWTEVPAFAGTTGRDKHPGYGLIQRFPSAPPVVLPDVSTTFLSASNRGRAVIPRPNSRPVHSVGVDRCAN